MAAAALTQMCSRPHAGAHHLTSLVRIMGRHSGRAPGQQSGARPVIQRSIPISSPCLPPSGPLGVGLDDGARVGNVVSYLDRLRLAAVWASARATRVVNINTDWRRRQRCLHCLYRQYGFGRASSARPPRDVDDKLKFARRPSAGGRPKHRPKHPPCRQGARWSLGADKVPGKFLPIDGRQQEEDCSKLA